MKSDSTSKKKKKKKKLTNKKESATENSLIAKQLSMGTKNFAMFHVGSSTAYNIGLDGGQNSLW